MFMTRTRKEARTQREMVDWLWSNERNDLHGEAQFLSAYLNKNICRKGWT